MNDYTDIEKSILRVLSDGSTHTKEELLVVMPDTLTSVSTLRVHICKLRIKLKQKGHDIVCQIQNRRGLYRHVRLLATNWDNKP